MQIGALVRWFHSFYFKYPLNFLYSSLVPIIFLMVQWWYSDYHVDYSQAILNGAYYYDVGFIVFGFFSNFITNRESGYLKQVFFFTASVRTIFTALLSSQCILFLINYSFFILVASIVLQDFSIVAVLKGCFTGLVYCILLGRIACLIALSLRIKQQTAIIIPSLLYLFFLSVPMLIGNSEKWNIVNPLKWIHLLYDNLLSFQAWIIIIIMVFVLSLILNRVNPSKFMPVNQGGV